MENAAERKKSMLTWNLTCTLCGIGIGMVSEGTPFLETVQPHLVEIHSFTPDEVKNLSYFGMNEDPSAQGMNYTFSNASGAVMTALFAGESGLI